MERVDRRKGTEGEGSKRVEGKSKERTGRAARIQRKNKEAREGKGREKAEKAGREQRGQGEQREGTRGRKQREGRRQGRQGGNKEGRESKGRVEGREGTRGREDETKSYCQSSMTNRRTSKYSDEQHFPHYHVEFFWRAKFPDQSTKLVQVQKRQTSIWM